jgi:hypothetical protein
MGFGWMVPEFGPVIRRAVVGKVVLDAGAGDLKWARRLVELGARKLIALDKEGPPRRIRSRIVYHQTYFDEFLDGPHDSWDVLFCAWPDNREMPGLLRLLRESSVVLVIAKNTDGTACGTPTFWKLLSHRRLLAAVEHPRNWLHVYGAECGSADKRVPTVEEHAGMFQHGPELTSEEGEKLVRVLTRLKAPDDEA